MANNRCTYQQTTNVSIPKQYLLQIAGDYGLSELDIRVCMALFTELNGWRNTESGKAIDPQNYTILDLESISDELDVKKKKVKSSIENLVNAGIIEEGSSSTVRRGYRFTF